MSLPKGFYIGAATAAHQVEGNNTGSDDWALEQLEHSEFQEPSGIACDHYHRYEEDIRLMAAAGLNAYRFSIEWARIEPEHGHFDDDEIEHYRRMIECCRQNGLEPILTLFHFTSPVWVIREGGWENEKVVDYFRDYVTCVISRLGRGLHYVVTINEANMRLQITMIMERFQRQLMAQMQGAAKAPAASDQAEETTEGQVQVGLNLKALMAGREAAAKEKAAIFGTPDPKTFVSPCTPEGDRIVMRAHEAAREAIRAFDPAIKVGLSLSLHDVQAAEGGEERAAREWDDEFLHYLPYIQNDDFLGVQNYTRAVIGADGEQPVPEGCETTQMGYEFYPEGLEHVLRRVAEEFHHELFVTENGVATDDDTRRVEFIRRALQGVEAAVSDGLPVVGYTYWSLLDNFEWQKGYSMRFGLVACDRDTMERTPKESLAVLGSYIKESLV